MIGTVTALYLIDQVRQGWIRGRGLTLGKLDPTFTFEQFGRLMAGLGMLSYEARTLSVTTQRKATIDHYENNGRILSHKPKEAQRGFVANEFFFRFVGLDEVYSVNYGAFNEADFAFDVNATGLSHLVGLFDFVFDAGMMESVFHTPNFLQNIYEVSNVGGIVFHQAPSNNRVDCGFNSIRRHFFGLLQREQLF